MLSNPALRKVVYRYPKDDTGTADKDADLVFKSILGEKYDRKVFSNACATRVSLGLLNGGVILKKDFIVQVGEFKGNGVSLVQLILKHVWSEVILGSPK